MDSWTFFVIDTKKANMVVFVDAKNSLVEIIQNIGRIVRKQPRDSTILIPCWVDKTKYDGAEDKDAVIREDLGKQGNFNGILNVISALRQHDPELYEPSVCFHNISQIELTLSPFPVLIEKGHE